MLKSRHPLLCIWLIIKHFPPRGCPGQGISAWFFCHGHGSGVLVSRSMKNAPYDTRTAFLCPEGGADLSINLCVYIVLMLTLFPLLWGVFYLNFTYYVKTIIFISCLFPFVRVSFCPGKPCFQKGL